MWSHLNGVNSQAAAVESDPIRSRPDGPSVLTGRVTASQITFTSQIRTKEGWLKLQGHHWGIYSLFHLCLRQNNYSCIFSSRHASMCTSGKLQSVPLKNSPPSFPHLHNKLAYKSLAARGAALHWISFQAELHWMIEVELSGISSVCLLDQSRWRQDGKWAGPTSLAFTGLPPRPPACTRTGPSLLLSHI